MGPVAIVIVIALSLIIGLFGRNRKFGFWGYFFCSLLLTPVIGLLVLLASDARPPPKAEEGGGR